MRAKLIAITALLLCSVISSHDDVPSVVAYNSGGYAFSRTMDELSIISGNLFTIKSGQAPLSWEYVDKTISWVDYFDYWTKISNITLDTQVSTIRVGELHPEFLPKENPDRQALTGDDEMVIRLNFNFQSKLGYIGKYASGTGYVYVTITVLL